MANPLSGWVIIPRRDLHQMVTEAIANEPKEKQRLRDAQSEFQRRAQGADTRKKFKILKEVADKYGYREEYLIEKVSL